MRAPSMHNMFGTMYEFGEACAWRGGACTLEYPWWYCVIMWSRVLIACIYKGIESCVFTRLYCVYDLVYCFIVACYA